MSTAKGFRRQAGTCAALAAVTDDDEIRHRYKRLERMYLELADSEELLADQAGAYSGDNKTEPATHRIS